MKIKVFPSALEIRPASTIFGTEFQAVKLSFRQAMAFSSGFYSFDHMLETYGRANILQIGEQYDGYIAVYYSQWQQDVIKIRGAVERFSELEALNLQPSDLREAALKGAAYKIVYRCQDGKEVCGSALYVWTFGDCRFAELIHILQQQKRFTVSIIPDVMEVNLKRKLISSIIADDAVEISEDENEVLLKYLGNAYYIQFISVFEEE